MDEPLDEEGYEDDDGANGGDDPRRRELQQDIGLFASFSSGHSATSLFEKEVERAKEMNESKKPRRNPNGQKLLRESTEKRAESGYEDNGRVHPSARGLILRDKGLENPPLDIRSLEALRTPSLILDRFTVVREMQPLRVSERCCGLAGKSRVSG